MDPNPMNDYNLSLLGGYFPTHDDEGHLFPEEMWPIHAVQKMIVKRVTCGLKPVGFLLSDEQDELIKIQKEITNAKILTNLYENTFGGRKWELALSQKGKIADFIDFTAVHEEYNLMLEGGELREYSDCAAKTLKELATKNFADFLSGWDYANPKGMKDAIICGVLLGLPVESTIDFVFDTDLYKNTST